MSPRSSSAVQHRRDWGLERERFLSQIAPDSHFHIVFDALGDVFFFAKNLAGETLFFSRSLLQHHGLDRGEQMLGATDDELTPGPFADRYKEQDQEVVRSRQPLLGMVDVWFDEVGLPDWYETNKFPILDRKGEVIGVMGTLRGCRGITPPGSVGARISPAVVMLRANIERFPSIDRLARACDLSPRHLQRAFQDIFTCSPRTFWMKCRIREACVALRDGHESITAISQRLGFCDQSDFTRQLRRHTGATPAEYRKRHGAARAKPATDA